MNIDGLKRKIKCLRTKIILQEELVKRQKRNRVPVDAKKLHFLLVEKQRLHKELLELKGGN